MNRFAWLAASFYGAVFAVSVFFRPSLPEHERIRLALVFFLIGMYAALVVIGTSGKKRSLSLLQQVVLAVLAALAIAGLLGATSMGLMMAAVIGLVFGFSADYWAQYV